jgi:hypothetical protein
MTRRKKIEPPRRQGRQEDKRRVASLPVPRVLRVLVFGVFLGGLGVLAVQLFFLLVTEKREAG